MVEVSIIIPTKNGEKRLGLLLNMTYSQEFKETFEVLVIDSGSIDRTLDIARDFKTKIWEIKPESFHHSRTRNLGAEMADGDYLVYTTQDVVPVDNQWLKNLIAPFDDEEVGAVYGRQLAHKNAKPMDSFFYNYFYPEKRVELTEKNVDDEKKFYLRNIFISDVNSAIKRDVWNEIRFREDIPFAEDKDFALRALKRGYKIVYEPKAIVYHSHDYSIASLFRRRFNDGIGFSRITSPSNNNKLTKDRDDFIIRGLRYWWKEIQFLVKNDYIRWIPYAILYDMIYLIAFELGKKEKCLGVVGSKILKKKGRRENEKA